MKKKIKKQLTWDVVRVECFSSAGEYAGSSLTNWKPSKLCGCFRAPVDFERCERKQVVIIVRLLRKIACLGEGVVLRDDAEKRASDIERA